MASLRESIAAEAQIGTVKFWATRASPSATPRRIAQYTGVGVNGAVTEDLGEDARTEILSATVTENIYIDLKDIKSAGNVVTCVHPLFGVFEGRLADITYDAGPDDMVDIQCTLVEHGDPNILLVTVNNAAAKRQSAKSVFDDLGLDDLDDFDTSTGLPQAGAAFSASYGTFDAVMDAVESGDALWQDVAVVYNDVASAGKDLIDAIDLVADITDELIDIGDKTLEIINLANEAIGEMERQVSDVWQTVKVTNPVSLSALALELMGDATEESINLILDRNPTLIDICALPTGVEISIPVIL